MAKSAVSGTVIGMETRTPQKLYAYVDESGQDTAGRLFVVSVLLLAEERDALLERLEALEARSGKHNTKWHKTRHSYRQASMEAIRDLLLLQQTLCVDALQVDAGVPWRLELCSVLCINE